MCDHTLAPNPSEYPAGPEWDAKRFGRISLSPDGFGELKIEIEQLCEVSKKCTYEFKKKMKDFWARYENMKGKLPSKLPNP
jgi:hypothetical protein